jgi:hypothetical protein
MDLFNGGHHEQTWKRGGHYRWILVVLFAVATIFLCNLSLAAEPIQRYQIVNGSDDKAYLVDTSSGLVWVLTYRTVATGREPVALPYKFLRIAPKDKPEILLEDVKGDTCLLPASNTK